MQQNNSELDLLAEQLRKMLPKNTIEELDLALESLGKGDINLGDRQYLIKRLNIPTSLDLGPQPPKSPPWSV